MNNIIKIIILVYSMSITVSAQDRVQLRGIVSDFHTGEPIVKCTVSISQDQTTLSDNNGKFSMRLLPADSLAVKFIGTGFKDTTIVIKLPVDTSIHVFLMPSIRTLDKMVISAKRDDIHTARMSSIEVSKDIITKMPVIFGESDVLKTVQLVPGVQSGNEGTTDFFVRGGAADQNLVLLDGAVVYNPNHLFGLFSTFNSDVIRNVSLVKGGFPSRFGGRLSSILDVTMDQGNNEEIRFMGGIGLVTSKFTLEGPIKKDRATFSLAARRTFADLIVRPILKIAVPKKKFLYSFYDLNGKLAWYISKKDKLFLTLYSGSDDAKVNPDKGMNYQLEYRNTAGVLSWNHSFGNIFATDMNIMYSGYAQDIVTVQQNSFAEVLSSIDDVRGKLELLFTPGEKHTVRIGIDATKHYLRANGKSDAVAISGSVKKIDRSALPVNKPEEIGGYLSEEFNSGKWFTMNIGVRVPGFFSADTSYYGIEPRLTATFSFGKTASLKLGYSEMNQFIHRVTSSTASIPTDILISSSKETKPQLSRQWAAGFFKDFKDKKYQTNLELYYKTMDNQVLFQEGNRLHENIDIANSLTYGKGWSYGMEVFLKKNRGPVTGWISYTLSKTDQQFTELNFGKTFPFRYDRRHVLSLIGFYEINDLWTLSLSFAFSTGTAYTVPVGRISVHHGGTLFEGNYFVYQDKNNARLEPYHRLDLSAIRKTRKEKSLFGRKVRSEWTFGIYNIYSNRNPYFVYYQVDPRTNQPKATQVSLLPILPSINYTLRF